MYAYVHCTHMCMNIYIAWTSILHVHVYCMYMYIVWHIGNIHMQGVWQRGESACDNLMMSWTKKGYDKSNVEHDIST